MLEAVAKAILFAGANDGVTIRDAVWDSGVYRIDLVSVPVFVPVKPFVNDIVDEHRLCKNLVELVLERDPLCRDDDMRLILSVWALQGVDISLDRASLDVRFSSESIRRSRQKVQNTLGKFLPTTYVVAKRRRINEELLREHYGKGEKR